MTAGLPGTGLGGFYYILLVALMPVREAYLTARGRSSLSRWNTVGIHLAIAGGILAAFFGSAWVIGRALNFMQRNGLINSSLYRSAVNASSATSKFAAIISVSILAFLLAGGCVLRLIVTGRGKKTPRLQAESAPWSLLSEMQAKRRPGHM